MVKLTVESFGAAVTGAAVSAGSGERHDTVRLVSDRHGHSHPHPAQDAPVVAGRRPVVRRSVFMASVLDRLIVALIGVGVLWAGVVWAIS